mmetsp:Transcript_6279/g.10788  ORF Transcript_6279/g.10788 Transcript_6279/m.10788 type:complete len:316 (-) Transcript_6279:1078-2025(-)
MEYVHCFAERHGGGKRLLAVVEHVAQRAREQLHEREHLLAALDAAKARGNVRMLQCSHHLHFALNAHALALRQRLGIPDLHRKRHAKQRAAVDARRAAVSEQLAQLDLVGARHQIVAERLQCGASRATRDGSGGRAGVLVVARYDWRGRQRRRVLQQRRRRQLFVRVDGAAAGRATQLVDERAAAFARRAHTLDNFVGVVVADGGTRGFDCCAADKRCNVHSDSTGAATATGNVASTLCCVVVVGGDVWTASVGADFVGVAARAKRDFAHHIADRVAPQVTGASWRRRCLVTVRFARRRAVSFGVACALERDVFG